jgi:ZIP family zinc transporter
MDILFVLLAAFLAGAVTLLGGLLLNYVRVTKRALQFAITATTGVIISVIMLGFLPDALALGGGGYTALGFMLGGMAMIITGALFPHTYGGERYEDKLYSILKTGSLVLTGIMIYNIPAGLMIGSGFTRTIVLGLAATLAVALQNIPRGVSLNPPLFQAGFSRRKGMFIMLMAGIPALLGALVVFSALGGTGGFVLGSGLAFASGAMFFVCMDQLVPLLKGYTRRHEAATALFIGVLAGILILGIG